MPRNQNPGNVALRNRNRVTNKTRLKVIKGNVDADPVVLDEDEERARVISTAGVDAEDANEHHLQAVLSAASHRATTLGQRATRAASEKVTKRNDTPAAYIPVPDAAGVVEGYSELYPCGKWIEPSTYLKFSDPVDDCITHALADGFTYFMDERDQDWLEKNNQESRGEGTSAQASVSPSGTTTRSGASHRSSKSRGKEPEMNTPVTMSEEEFELVMGIFEKITHDNTPFLHVSLQQGMVIPPFSTYQDVFASDLPSSMFATFVVPTDIPPPPLLSRMARAVYAYWHDRRLEREGHRIIPSLNYDESDTNNESYICFRRREIKAIRKTRATQVTSSDKLLRLKGELSTSLEMAQLVLSRENQKREAAHEAQRVWEKRLDFVDLKRKFPALLGGKEDEELLFDKERIKRPLPSETPAVLRIKNRPSVDTMLSPASSEPQLRPRDRTNMIQTMVEEHMKRHKERDHHWDDQIDNPYQAEPVPQAERLFKAIPPTVVPTFHPSSLVVDPPARAPRHLRLRVGRGGRWHLDRRLHSTSPRSAKEDYLRREPRFPQNFEGLDQAEMEERSWRISQRWKYDLDTPLTDSDGGVEEEDRTLVDDFNPRFLRHSMHLIQEHDHAYLTTDPRLFLPDGHNGVNVVLPFRVSPPMQAPIRREAQGLQRPSQMPAVPHQTPSQHEISGTSHQGSSSASSSGSGTPISMQTPVRKMQPPNVAQQIRVPSVPSNGVPRPPATPTLANMQPSASGTNSSPTSANASAGGSGMNGNSTTHGAPNNSMPKVSMNGQPSGVVMPASNTAVHLNFPGSHDSAGQGRAGSPARPMSQNQHHPHSQQTPMANGYVNGANNGTYNGYTNGVPNGYANHSAGQHHVLSVQQAQNLKVAFAGIPSNQGIPMQPSLPTSASVPPRPPSAYAQHLPNGGPNGTNFNMIGPVNMNLKLPTTRQMQWAAGQRPPSGPNGTDAGSNPNLSHASPGVMIRAPSANGHHLSPPMRSGPSPSNHMHGQSTERSSPVNPHLSHSLPPHNGSPHAAHMHPSPSRAMQTPVPSPSLQQQQAVGGHNLAQGY